MITPLETRVSNLGVFCRLGGFQVLDLLTGGIHTETTESTETTSPTSAVSMVSAGEGAIEVSTIFHVKRRCQIPA
jgi:hypothetical protein